MSGYCSYSSTLLAICQQDYVQQAHPGFFADKYIALNATNALENTLAGPDCANLLQCRAAPGRPRRISLRTTRVRRRFSQS